MAINFEAANLAGYNNPKIEMLKAIMDFETNAIIEAPAKPEIIRCLHRGSIPAIMCTSPDGSEGILLWITTWASVIDGDNIVFGNIGLVIAYSPDSDTPIAGNGG